MKKFLIIMLTGLLVLTGCQSKDNGGSGTSTDKENKDIKISFITKAMDSEFWYEMKAGAEKAAEELGVKVDFAAPDVETNVERQFNIIQDSIAANYDAIVVAPTDSDGVVPILQSALDKNIKVIGVDTNFELPGKSGFVGTDNVQIGKTAAATMKDLVGEGEVVMITGVPGVQTMRDRAQGFKDNLDPALKLVDDQPADSDSGKAMNVMENMISSNPNIKGLYVLNTTMATGSLRAIEQFGKDIEIISVDTSEDHIKFVNEGKIAGFVSQDSFGMGYHSVVNAVKAIKGETFEENQAVEAIMVTKDNIKEFEENRKKATGE